MNKNLHFQSDYWHYPRNEFANNVYEVLVSGVCSALILKGPQRSGKTTFILNDLEPYVKKHSHGAIYANFTQDSSPVAVLWNALVDHYEAIQKQEGDFKMDFARRPKLCVDDRKPGTKFNSGTKASIITEEHFLILSYMLKELVDYNKPSFLFLDEIQELARSNEGLTLLARLRAILNRNQQGMKVIFMGSSAYGLREVFADKSAPFFRFAVPVELPALGDDFVEFMNRRFKAITSRSIEPNILKSAFERFRRSSFLFKIWISEIALNPELDPNSSIDSVVERAAESLGFDKYWRTLTPQNRAMARLVAESKTSPLSCEGGDYLTKLMSNRPMTAQSRQSMLRTLVARDIVQRRGRGCYEVTDPLLRDYILNRPETDYRA